MKLIVISDTHSETLPSQLWEDIKKSDLIIHVGDFCDIGIYKKLEGLKPIRAVYGNMDGLDLRGVLPRKAVFKCEGVTIGLFHGEGGPDNLMERVKAAFEKEKVALVIFGHSHQAFNELINGVRYFNPGSPTDTTRAAFRSYGIVTIAGDSVAGSIVKIK